MAQSNLPSYNPGVENIIPPSPTAGALGKYGSVPVGLSTGIPNISIPLYSYTQSGQGNLGLDISLNYHAGGMRVDEVSSDIGIGWSLSAGGVITRTMKSIPDETPSIGFINTPPLPTDNYDGNTGDLQFRKFNNIYGGVLDAEMDVFNFNFNGRSGRFVFGKNNDFLMLTQQKLKVEKETGQVSGQTMITKFTVTDELGYKYVFNDYETTLSSGIAFGAAKRFTSSWYLTEIVAPSDLEKITFQYEATGYSYSVSNSLSIGIAAIGSNITAAPGRGSTLYTSITGKRIKAIGFPDGGSVSFTYNSAQRTDLPGDYALAGVALQNGIQNWGFSFNQDYSLNRLTLKKVGLWEGTPSTEKGFYGFEYSDEAQLPNRLTSEQDHWGFYNSNPSQSMIPAETLPNPIGGHSSLPGGNRNTHTTRVKAGSQKKITYPTGGFTVFELEANRVTDTRAGQNVAVGGLRVKKILDFDPIANAPTVREYEYLLENSTMTSGKLGIFPVYSHPVFYDFAKPVNPIPVSYTPGQPNQIMRSTSPIHEIAYANGSPVSYTRVVEKTFNAGGYEGRAVSNFSAFSEGSVTILKPFPYVPPDFKQWTYGLPLSEEVYDKNNNLLRKTVNEYDLPADNYSANPARQANFRSITIAPVKYLYYGTRHTFIDDYWVNQGEPIFFLSEGYLPPSGRSELKKKTVYEYNGTNVMVTENTYVYNQDYYNLKSETLKNSKGENIVKNYIQPFDMVSLNRDPTGVYQAMVGGNIISPVVELTEHKNTVQTYLVRNNYFNPHTGVYVPQTVVTKKSSSPEDMVFRYETYDSKGRPLTVSRTAWGAKTSFIWAYNGQLPIAETKNAAQNQVSHTSFETGEKGGWTYSGTPVVSATSRTGRKYYNLGTGNITKSGTGATVSDPFRLTFWARRASGSGNWTFMGQTESLSTTWKLIEREVTGSSVTISGSGIYVDELRLHPAGAQMTTYTYDPLIGITSSTDVRNYTTYYEYDGTGRLETVKNEDGHILEHYEYNYMSGN